MVDDVTGSQLLPDILKTDAGLHHQDHHMIGEVRDLVDGFLPVFCLACYEKKKLNL